MNLNVFFILTYDFKGDKEKTKRSKEFEPFIY